jgi:methylated-DNA-[protein]-cysteine S-methyltransferase
MNGVHGSGAETARAQVRTALGDFAIVASASGLRSVTPLAPGAARESEATGEATADGHVRAAAAALSRYAAGERVRYDGALDVAGTDFERAVWERLRAIPFGATASYGEIAAAMGVPGEARAVGAAIAANPVCILVPCHRVVGADGSLRGFAWGLDLKRRLLAHEGTGALSLFA